MTGEHDDVFPEMDGMSGDDGPAPPVSKGTIFRVGLRLIRAILQAIFKRR